MDGHVDLESALLENFELILGRLSDSRWRAQLCSYYATLKMQHFQQWGKMDDLEEAIEKMR